MVQIDTLVILKSRFGRSAAFKINILISIDVNTIYTKLILELLSAILIGR